jgi:hypothetical protein
MVLALKVNHHYAKLLLSECSVSGVSGSVVFITFLREQNYKHTNNIKNFYSQDIIKTPLKDPVLLSKIQLINK